MKRRQFLKATVGMGIVCSGLIYSYQLIDNDNNHRLISHILSIDGTGFSIKCAIVSGGMAFIKAAHQQQVVEQIYGQVEVGGYLLNAIEFDNFVSEINRYYS